MMRRLASFFLFSVALTAVFARFLAPYPYDEEFREAPNAPPGAKFLLGTDETGRDRFSRLLCGTQVSLLLAPAASLVSIVLALAVSLPAASRIPGLGPLVSGATTLCLSLPWIFVFIVLRARLPLDTQPVTSVLLTFGLMGIAGWAAPARIFTASLRDILQSGWMLQARAAGLRGGRIVMVHVWPHLQSLVFAQLRVLIPACILAEAGLGLLGLGVAEPLPSWGNLLKDLQHPDIIRANPWVLAPLLLLMAVMVCIEVLSGRVSPTAGEASI